MSEPAADNSELRAFEAELSAAATDIVGKTLPVVKKGATNIKAQMRSEMSSRRHFRQIAPTISYDITGGSAAGGDYIEAEIGPSSEPGSRGNLANIAYFGGAHGGGGSVPDPRGALDTEVPRFLDALADLAEDI